jgi:hypothetical protein
MTYIRPDKKGLGLDIPGPDEPSYYSSDADTEVPRRWLMGRSPLGSVVAGIFWMGVAVFYFVGNLYKPHTQGMDWFMPVAWGALSLTAFGSALYYSRSRRARSRLKASATDESSAPDAEPPARAS